MEDKHHPIPHLPEAIPARGPETLPDNEWPEYPKEQEPKPDKQEILDLITVGKFEGLFHRISCMDYKESFASRKEIVDALHEAIIRSVRENDTEAMNQLRELLDWSYRQTYTD